MNATRTLHRSLHVVAAIAVVVVLVGLLGIRLLAWESVRAAAPPLGTPGAVTGPRAPASTLPPPKNLAGEALRVPCWSCPGHEGWPVRFQTDLDLLAPLGAGAGNAGAFFKDFAKPDGPRFPEAMKAMERRIDGPADLGKVFPPDDPLLIEAEPWCDQATMRFYPEFFKLDGWSTQLPNLLVPLNLARSWVARGMSAGDPAKALEDFRRAIRLGRLLRQEDVTVIADLVGLACIRAGTQAIYDLAVKQGDTPLALAAAIVLGEHAPQRLLTSEHLTRTELKPYLYRAGDGGVTLSLPEERLDAMLAIAKGDSDRRFRCEAIIMLNIVHTLGLPAQRARALTDLTELAAASDPIVAASATWSRDTRIPPESLAEVLGMGK